MLDYVMLSSLLVGSIYIYIHIYIYIYIYIVMLGYVMLSSPPLVPPILGRLGVQAAREDKRLRDGAHRPEEHDLSTMIRARSLLGWLRLGWLEIA